MSRDRQWQLVTLTVARDAEESISAVLFDLGTTGTVTLEEGDDSVKLGAYFDPKARGEEKAREIQAAAAREGLTASLLSISASEIPEQDWMQKWKEGFEPVEVSDRLIVAPSWRLPEDPRGRAVIQIDPGMAFGTGTHETTRLCLGAIERHFNRGSLLDVGTGTGILAIAAARVAPGSRITAIDIDPQAVAVARENVEINGVADRIELLEGGPGDFAGRGFDVVVANLTAEVIVGLMADLAGCLARPGLLIMSGILTTLAGEVEQAAAGAGLEITERREAGEWSLVVARR
jgi:ribosomal protein L11 methyltransferase